ncbi:Ig-like domain repeat protein [Corynebacterium sp. 320]|uniref:Ig-like domain-containing protein n=1 Tax=Corynebacterium TaxID=1716 RepID=UPI00125CAEAB|nr:MULTISPECIES: Ig-like domain-containing protein [Corynebacterium]KAB1504473.1 Ig-like domain repeat protein [Corynebacterium sp. 320]KAB3528609.1 Ig-like domain repeat protein [Corynebacterium sp. 250]QNP92154.1 Ig-like domain repeat protein [Corynebacterium zhongnanshanii]
MRNTTLAAATALLAAVPVVLSPAATAESASASHRDSSAVFTRAVSTTTPVVGDTLTYAQRFVTTGGNETIRNWSNNHDTCLRYIPGSATVQVGARDAVAVPDANVTAAAGRTTIRSTSPNGAWIYNQANPYTLAVSYEVTDSCKPGAQLQSGFWYDYNGWIGTGNKNYAPNLFKGGPVAVVQDGHRVKTSLSLGAVDRLVEAGAEVPLTATLAATPRQGQEAPATLAGNTITFFNGREEVCSAQTDESGTATCTWTPAAPGTANISARFAQSDDLFAAATEAQPVKIVRALPKAPKDLSVSPEKLTNAQHAVVSGTATPEARIEALGPGGTRCVATADDQGHFECNLGYLPAGTGHTISVAETVDGERSPAGELMVDVAGAQQKADGSTALGSSQGLLAQFFSLLGPLGDLLARLFRF